MPDAKNSIRLLQWITIAWMSIELAIALAAGIRAHSPALTAFGADSAIELISAFAVLCALSASTQRAATKITAWMLLALAAFIIISGIASLLLPDLHPRPTIFGMVLLLAAACIMPILARAKRRLATATGNAALRHDAVQSAACAWLSWIALAGLALNWLLHWTWADSIASFALLPFILREARDAFRGESCC